MKKKIGLFILLFVFITSIWYLFFKPYDYLVTFKANTFPGTINQTIKLWSKSIDTSTTIMQEDIQNISYNFTVNDSTYNYNWKLVPINDSTSKVKVYIKDINHSLINKIKIPFSETNFEKTTKRILLNFNKMLTEHLKRFKVTVVGKDTFASTYCAYTPIKSTQLQKAKGMMQNYSLLSNFVATNKIKLNGTPIVEITKWNINTDSIHYNFCYPIIKSDSLPKHNLIKYKQLKIRPSLKAIYNGNYKTSDLAWYALLDYAERNKIKVIPKPIEVFHNNPNMGGDELNWKTEVFMPIK